MLDVAISALTGQVADDDASRLEAIRALEDLKCRAEARQAELTAALTDSGAREVAQARRVSHHRAKRHVGLAGVLTRELPHTMAAFRDGRISEWRATLMARETACLTLDDRLKVDAALARDADRLEAMGDRDIISGARKLAARLDPASVAERRRLAESERRVTLRPAPDCMTYLTALLPVAQGVAAYASLLRAADSARAEGDPRGKGQVMADTFVERVTGQRTAPDVPVAVNVVISDQALLGASNEAALLDGHGPIPSGLAREWIDAASRRQLRRLYATPHSGQLVAMESRSRTFPTGLARMIRFRDQFCTTPWCNAPIRHLDHVLPDSQGGPTTYDNGQGLCEACNYAKHTRTADPTSRPHAPPVPRPWEMPSRMEIMFREILLAS